MLKKRVKSLNFYKWIFIIFVLLCVAPESIRFWSSKLGLIEPHGETKSAGFFLVKDNDGNDRVVIGTYKDGNPYISLKGKDGTSRLKLELDRYDDPITRFYGANEKNCIQLDVDKEGGGIIVGSSCNEAKVEISGDARNSGYLGTYTKDGKIYWSAP